MAEIYPTKEQCDEANTRVAHAFSTLMAAYEHAKKLNSRRSANISDACEPQRLKAIAEAEQREAERATEGDGSPPERVGAGKWVL